MNKQILIRTFGHKYGPPPHDAHFVFDARHIANPHSVPGMERLTGYDQPIEQFIKAQPGSDLLLASILQQVDPMLDNLETGRLADNTLVIAIGCKGGRQRSVCLARLCADRFHGLLSTRHMQAQVELLHRDMTLDLDKELAKGDLVYAHCC
jgi:UPF0042 nucleotide-binding protein